MFVAHVLTAGSAVVAAAAAATDGSGSGGDTSGGGGGGGGGGDGAAAGGGGRGEEEGCSCVRLFRVPISKTPQPVEWTHTLNLFDVGSADTSFELSVVSEEERRTALLTSVFLIYLFDVLWLFLPVV
jgi:hypothetical protein